MENNISIDNLIKPKSLEEVKDLENRGFIKDKNNKWKFQINIKDIIDHYDQNEDTNHFKNSLIGKLLSIVDDVALFGNDKKLELLQIIEQYQNLNDNPKPVELDKINTYLYNFADKNYIWIGSFNEIS